MLTSIMLHEMSKYKPCKFCTKDVAASHDYHIPVVVALQLFASYRRLAYSTARSCGVFLWIHHFLHLLVRVDLPVINLGFLLLFLMIAISMPPLILL